jgi:hypothetical protein
MVTRPNKKESNPMAFEVKPNTGSLFRAEKDKETDRDYSGQANIGGELFWVSGYLKTSKNGKKYLDLRCDARRHLTGTSLPTNGKASSAAGSGLNPVALLVPRAG